MATEAELVEVFRLGEAAGVPEVVRVVGDRLAGEWVQVSRFRDVLALTERSRRVQISGATLGVGGSGQGHPRRPGRCVGRLPAGPDHPPGGR